MSSRAREILRGADPMRSQVHQVRAQMSGTLSRRAEAKAKSLLFPRL